MREKEIELNVYCFGNNNAIFVTGLLKIPVLVLIVTTRTRPSFPGWTWITLASGHLVGIRLSSCNTTTSPTSMFLLGWYHLVKRLRLEMYSVDHLFQKWWMTDWQRCHRWSREIGWYEDKGSGSASEGLPMRKCPGVRTSTTSSSHCRGVSGRLFKEASIWVRTVDISSNVNLTLAVLRFRWVFICCFLESTEVRSTFRYELPYNTLCRAKCGYGISCLTFLEELE